MSLEEVADVMGVRNVEKGHSAFPGATVVLNVFPFASERIVRLEERLVEWNEFCAENLGQLKLVRGNTEMGLGNRGCGQRRSL